MSIWNTIWINDSYSESNLRKTKATYKIEKFYNFLNLTNKSTCVDIGCGGGYISYEITKHSNCKIIGIDSSKEAIDFALKNNSNPNIEYLVASAENIPLQDESADIVLCIGVLEHIQNIDKALKEINRILKPKGRIVVVTSNCFSTMFFDRIIKQLFNRWKYGYQKNWKLKKLHKKLVDTGFTILEITVYQGIGDFNVKTIIDTCISKIDNHWGRYIQYIGEKKI